METSEQFSHALVGQLKAAREAQGISQYELSRRSGISRTMIHHTENRRRNPTLITAYALARAMDLDFSMLAGKAQKILEGHSGKSATPD